jgi:DNA topoisomerase-2
MTNVLVDKTDVSNAGAPRAIIYLFCTIVGEASLSNAIVNLAQTYVGTNNLNILQPLGQFGSRNSGGEDAASPRYIFTKLAPEMRLVFNGLDTPLLDRLSDKGQFVEVKIYAPIVPMLLVNGCEGIGWGFSTTILLRSPSRIIENLLRMLEGLEPLYMGPYWSRFKGSITAVEGKPGQHRVEGSFKRVNGTTLSITELPIGVWTESYKAKVLESGFIEGLRSVHNLSTEESIHIDLVFDKIEDLNDLLASGTASDRLRLVKEVSDNKMYAFDALGVIKKYASVEDILAEYYMVRLELYSIRRRHILRELDSKMKSASRRQAFIEAVVEGRLVVFGRRRSDILRDMQYVLDPKPSNEDAQWLLQLTVHSFTAEQIGRLMKEIKTLKEEHKDLMRKSPQQLWKDDLLALQKLVDH